MKTTKLTKIALATVAALAATTSFAPAALAGSDITSVTKNVTITVPARLTIEINSGTVALRSDPTETGSENQASTAAALTVKSNYGTSTTVSVSATTPTSGSNTITVSDLKYQVNGSVSNGLSSTATVNKGASWAGFSNSAEASVTINGRTNGTTINYDYQVDRSWAYPAGTYNSTVTYTIAGT